METTELRMKRPDQLKPRDSYPNSLRLLRLRAGLSCRALGNMIGVTPQAIHRYEIYGKGLNGANVLALVPALGCTAEELREPVKYLP